MDPSALILVLFGNAILAVIFLAYFRSFQTASQKHTKELESRERQLKRQVLELQVLRSLGERVGYSLDIRKILEVIIESLQGLVEYSTVSYMMLGSEGQVILKIHITQPTCQLFIDQVKSQMLNALSVMAGKNLQRSLVNETITGSVADNTLSLTVESFFNLPIVVGGKVLALINVSSPQKGLYGDEETAILYTILNQISESASKLSQVIENEKRRLSAMIASLTDGVMMVDLSFNLIVTNPALPRLLGIREVNHFLDVVAAVGTRADLRRVIEQSLARHQLVKLSEFEIGGSAVAVDVEPVRDKFGYLLGASVVFHDVTEQRHLERLREDFTAMMVHELRTPLTTIAYSADMILSDLVRLTPAQIEQQMGIVKLTTAQMLSLVSGLLDVAKIEAGKFEVVKSDEEIGPLLEEKIAIFKPLAEKKNLRLVSEIDPGLGKVSFDRQRLGQALDNLISNALKYTEAGHITLKAKKEAGRVLVSVSDSGDGIEPRDIPKLFSKFEQLGKGKIGERSGTGLGLVITRGIIEAHGGKIWAESEGPGEGSTFTFSLPQNGG